MTDDFVAFILYNKLPQPDAAALQRAVVAAEPNRPATVSAAGAGFAVQLGRQHATIEMVKGRMPEEAAISSFGMADLPESDRARLLNHAAYAIISCDAAAANAPMEAMILLLKTGMALCELGGLALCIPACGICLMADTLEKYTALNQGGPRAWGVDESEAALGSYEKHTLWDSLRAEAEPAEIVVGFVPAQVDGKAWFFSAGHSLFGMPELALSTGNLEDYAAIREFFRVAFRSFYQNPTAMQAGQTVQISDVITLALEPLPAKYKDFEASTGTLMVRVVESFAPDKDWD